MKKIILLILLVFTYGVSSFGQNKFTEIEKLTTLGKIYGYLKYYHPEVGKGKINWDKELIKHIPKVIEATDKKTLSKVYNDWIDSLGNIKECKECNSNEPTFDKNFNLSWSQNSYFFNKKLIRKLKHIEKNRIQEGFFYVNTTPVGNIKVINEPVYKNFEYPNEQYRLLGLFKYWNIIEYFYPYKYLTDQNWDSVLKEMIPKFQDVLNKEEYQYTIKELIAKLDDTHVQIGFRNGRTKYLPVKISNIENEAVISGFYNDSLASINNLKLGDIVVKVNDIDIKKETDKKSKYIAGSNINIKIRNTYRKIINGIDSTTSLTIKRNNQIKKIKVRRYKFKDFKYYNNPLDIKSKSISDKIGYVNMKKVKSKDISEIFKAFEKKKTIIIDLRNYPAFIYRSFSNYLNSKKRYFTKIYSPNLKYPGKFIYTKNLQTGTKNKNAFKGKTILLVNDESLSRSEFTAMAFQTADNVITVGNQTAGADGTVSVFEYIGGFRTSISGNGILYPNGSETQRKGVKIDIVIKPTINGLRHGRDEVLEKAIELASK
ncbi:S41 family peptidase [Tenacibaculum halocynthiae]|uniref:S41 family peptidase n=1 Tax=Tenacibaculum halocynthiae TaxID=1254437 RepID=UPI003D65E047